MRLAPFRLLSFLLAVPVLPAQSADLILKGGLIYTGTTPRTAEAVAVRGREIVYVGDAAGVAGFLGPSTQVIELEGKFVYPGLVDSHAHFTGIGQREMNLNLEGTHSKEAFLARVADRVRTVRPGEWISGRGWIETFWSPSVFPTRQDLDRVAPDNPVALTRADGHAIIANSLALKLANVTGSTRAPSGGAINLDAKGEPTGMLIDQAQSLVTRLIPSPTEADLERALELANQRELSLGWTAVHDAHGSFDEVDRMRRLYQDGRIQIRTYKAVSGPGRDANRLIQQGPGQPEFDGLFTLRAIKLVMDGALGSRGAALLAPYSDDPHTSGLITMDTASASRMMVAALRKGIQVMTHSIGDRGNRLTLNLYESAFNAVPVTERKVADPRWRDEHSQILSAADLPRFKQLGVIASMQPSHAIGDLFFVPSRLGLERTTGTYAWQTLMKQGVVVTGGTDAPVERGEPMIEFYAAVSRRSLDGQSGAGWHPEEALSRDQALKMFTLNPAYASFREDRFGTVEPGKIADFTILDRDIMTIPEAEILQTRNMLTVVNGKVVYQRQ